MNKRTIELVMGLIILTIPNMLYAAGGAAMSHAVSGDYGAVGIIIIIVFIIGLLIRAGVFQKLKEELKKEKKEEDKSEIIPTMKKILDDLVDNDPNKSALVRISGLRFNEEEIIQLFNTLTEKNIVRYPLQIPKNKIGKIMKINGDELKIDKDIKILDTFRIDGDASTKLYIVTEVDNK